MKRQCMDLAGIAVMLLALSARAEESAVKPEPRSNSGVSGSASSGTSSKDSGGKKADTEKMLRDAIGKLTAEEGQTPVFIRSGDHISSSSVNGKTHVEIVHNGKKTERDYAFDVKVTATDSDTTGSKKMTVKIEKSRDGTLIETFVIE